MADWLEPRREEDERASDNYYETGTFIMPDKPKDLDRATRKVTEMDRRREREVYKG